VKHLLASDPEVRVVCVDALTYAGRRENLAGFDVARYDLRVLDIRGDRAELARSLEGCDALYHLAAETHVTRSETDAGLFYSTNVAGTVNLLVAAADARVPRIVHVSTDEVYGPAEEGVFFREDEKTPGVGRATSAYAKSKALADDIALDMGAELDLSVIVARPTNAYGPRQFPEKLLPRSATRILRGLRAHIWGDGSQVRDWLHARDVARGLVVLAEHGAPGSAYNIAANNDPEIPNHAAVAMVAEALGRTASDAIEMVPDPRPRHDPRYGVDCARIRALGWEPLVAPSEGIPAAARWYRDNPDWWAPLVERAEAIYAVG
jgi:dTDP-glucose 4,6-dehydratase